MRDRRDMVCVQGGGGWGVEGLLRGASPDYNLTFPTAWNDRKYNRPLCSLHILQPTVKCKLAFSKSEYQLQTHRMSDKYQSTAAKKYWGINYKMNTFALELSRVQASGVV